MRFALEPIIVLPVVFPLPFRNSMRKLAHFPFVLIFSVLLLSCPAVAQDAPHSIAGLTIRGNDGIDIGEIRSVISEIVPPRKLFFWKPLPQFDRLRVEENIERLRQFIAGNGYYGSSVVWRSGSVKNKKTVRLIIDINLGSPVTVREVVIETEGEKSMPPEHIAEIRKALETVPLAGGERFSPRRFKEAKGVVRNALLELGYAKAAIKSRGEVHRGERWAFVKFTVDPGKLYTFGNTDIEVSEEVLRDLVRKNILYKTGEPSSPSKLFEAKRHLVNLGYFDSVSITSEIDDRAGVVNTVVTPVRSKTMTFQLGVGAGRVDIVRGRVKLINRSFFNLNRTFEVSARASFASQGIRSLIRQDGIFGADSSFSLLFDVRRDDFPSYEAEFLIGSAEFRKTFFRKDLSVYFKPSVIDSQIISQAGGSGLTRGFEDVFLATLRTGVDLVRTDNPIDPGRGFAAGFQVEFSDDWLGSEQEYVKAVFRNSAYYGLGGIVFAGKLNAGFIEPFGSSRGPDIPLFERLFAGGSKSMRGFSFQKLGPLDSNGDPLGGNSLITGSVEARIPLIEKLGAAVFLDGGNVFAGSFDYDLDELKYAAGAGLRYKVAGIPISLDFGYALNPNPRLGRYQLFIDVGQAF